MARAEQAVVTHYDRPIGYAPLRAHIARRVAEKGVSAEPDQIVLVDSASQALDLICRFLLQPGDTVLVDDPCYFNFIALLRAQRVAVVGVPMTPDGPDLGALATLLAQHHPRFYLTNSALQNPTGTSLAPATAHRVLKLCEAHDTLIVEDEIFGDLEPEPAPRLAAFDGLDRVIQIGGFSKTLTAAARLRLDRGASGLGRAAGRSQADAQPRQWSRGGGPRPQPADGCSLSPHGRRDPPSAGGRHDPGRA